MHSSSIHLYLDLGIELLAALALAALWEGRFRVGWRWGRTGALAVAVTGGMRARSFLRHGLGILWVLDGLLQAQPGMPAGFAAGILSPAAQGQPAPLAALLHWEAAIWQLHPAHFAVATVLVQLGVGLAILFGGDGRIGRTGLWASIAWGVLVWVGAEALGGVLAPGASLLSGSPGAVLGYVVAAALLLLPVQAWSDGRVTLWLERTVAAFLLLGAGLQMLPLEGFWYRAGLSGLLGQMASSPQPGPVAVPIHVVASWTAADPLLWNTLVFTLLVGLAVALLLGGAGRVATGAGLLLLLLVWWFGQDFGTLGTGVATDPNLAPVLAMLLVSARLGRLSAHPAPEGLISPAWREKVAALGVAAVLVGTLVGAAYLPQGKSGPPSTSTTVASAGAQRS